MPRAGVIGLRSGQMGAMTEQDPVGQQEAQVRLQQIADVVEARHRGDEVGVVRAELQREISAAGLGEQPDKWLDDLAAEISAGRTMVVDRNRTDRTPTERPADRPHGTTPG